MITKEEYQSAMETVKLYRLQCITYKYQQLDSPLSGDTLISDPNLSTRVRNQLGNIGEWYGLCSGSSCAGLRLQDFQGLDRQKLSLLRGMDASTLTEVECVLTRAGVRLR